MAATSNVIPFGLLYMRPLQWWLRTKRFSPEGQLVSHDQGYMLASTPLKLKMTYGTPYGLMDLMEIFVSPEYQKCI